MIKKPEEWLFESNSDHADAWDYLFIGLAIFIGLAGMIVGLWGIAT